MRALRRIIIVWPKWRWTHWPSVALLVLPLQFFAPIAQAKVTAIQVTPAFETAGVQLSTDSASGDSAITVSVKAGAGSATPVHPAVRYDGGHLATSLFGLTPNTEYTVVVTDGSSTEQQTFRTRAEFVRPAAKRVVKVSSGSALSAALAAAQPGDEIALAPGNYPGGLTIAASGTAADPIVITGEISAAELAKPIAERAGLPRIQGAGDNFGLTVTGAYIVVQHVRFEQNAKGGVRLDGASYAVIQQCQVYDNGTWANILITHGGSKAGYHVIQDNHIADLVHQTEFAYGGSGDDSVTYYGIRNDDTPGPGTVLRRNRIEQHYDGITPCPDEESTASVEEGAADVLATWPVHDIDVYDNVIVNQRDDAIEADGICVNARIFRNWISRSTNSISVAPSLPGPYFIVRNFVLGMKQSSIKLNTGDGRGTIRNIFIYHNTFVKDEDSQESENAPLYLWDGTPSKGITFRNNIFVSKYRCLIIQEAGTHNPDLDYDLWFTPLGPGAELFIWWNHWKASWADYRTHTGHEVHGVFGDPLLDQELRIVAGSTALDCGVVLPGINDGFGGKAPDVGAFEVGGTQQPPASDGSLVGPNGDGGSNPGTDGGASSAGDGRGGDGCALTAGRHDGPMHGLSAAAMWLMLATLLGLTRWQRARRRG